MFGSKFGNSKIRPYAEGIQLQTSVYGSTIPVPYGRTRIAPLIIWANNYRKSGGSSKKGKTGKKGGSPQTYEENIDFLIGHNPIVLPIEFWSNNTKGAMRFSTYSVAITPGGVGSVTVPNPNGFFRCVLGVTLTVSYDETFDDYGGQGAQQFTGSHEIPLWNACYAGPDPANNSAYRYYPYVYRWLPFSGSTIYLDFNPLGALPAGTLKVYYSEAIDKFSQDQLFLQFEPQLGDGIAYGSAYAAQQIIYPQYAGLGSANFDLGTGALPAIKFEVLGAFPLYPTGDADFADMVEDIFKSGPAQCALGLAKSRTEIHHGLNCYDYPAVIQKKFYTKATSFSSCVFDLPNTAGNFLVVFASTESTAGLGISDAAGNTWTPIFAPGLTYQGWYATALAAEAGNEVTITGLGNQSDVMLLEVAGVDAFDAVATASGTSAIASGSITTTNEGGTPAFILAWTNLDTTETLPTVAPGSRWPVVVQGPAFQWAQGRAVWFPGSYTISNPLVASSAWRMALLSFKCSQPPPYPKPLGNVLDEASLELCRKAARAYGLWGSATLDSQKKASEWLEQFCQAMNAAPIWSGFKLKFVPYAEASAVGNGAVYISPTASGPVADLGEGDFIAAKGEPPVRIERTGQVDAPNVLQMEHPNRTSDYNQVVTSQPDQASIALYGVRKDNPVTSACVQDAAIARKLLGISVRRANYFRNQYRFKLKAKWKLLEPMDLVTLTDTQAALDHQPVRLTKVSEDAEFNLDCEAKDFIYGSESPQVNQGTATTQEPHPQPINTEPASVNAPVIFQPPVRLSNGQSEIWFVVSDSDANYGGCVVYVSTDGGASYKTLGAIHGNAATGVTVATWPAAADPDSTNDLMLDLSESLGTLASYVTTDEDNFVYPCYVAGGAGSIPYELMSYAVAQLTSAYHYTLKATGSGNYLRRSVYGAPTAGAGVSHASGSRFAFVDPSGNGILKVSLNPSWIGKTLKFKFPAFNQYGGGLQSLTGLPVYDYTPYDLGGGLNPNNTDYTVDPCPCLSQPSGQYKVNLAATTAHFPSNDAAYQARQFTVSDPDPSAGTASIPPATNVTVESISVTAAGLHKIKTTSAHGMSTGARPHYYDNDGFKWEALIPSGVPITVVDSTHFTLPAGTKALYLIPWSSGPQSGYVVGDIVTIDPTGINVTARVASVNGFGQALSLDPITDVAYPIQDCSVIFNTSGGSGTGLQVKIQFAIQSFGAIRVVRGAVRIPVYHGGALIDWEIGNPGSGYAVGDIFLVTGGGGSGAQFRVTSVGSGGAVLAVTWDYCGVGGAGYHPTTGAATSSISGIGSGLTLNITNVDRSLSIIGRLIDVNNVGAVVGGKITIAGVANSIFNGTRTVWRVYDRLIDFGMDDGAFTVSGGGTVAGGAGTSQVYYVTVYDPGYVGDSQGLRPAYCETNQSKVGVVGYTFMGSIYVTHAGGAVTVTCGGWPAPQKFLVNGG
jgi:hypothetical protein